MIKSTDDNTKSRKPRPKVTGELVGVRLQPELLDAIDEWRSGQRPIPSRPEALRLLAERGLTLSGISEATDSIVHLGGEMIRGIQITERQKVEFLDAVVTLFEAVDDADDDLKESLERLKGDVLKD